jgi:hypothetical protein
MNTLINSVINPSPVAEVKYTAKDFSSDQDVRWCPGCGDYSILAQVQRIMPELNVPSEKVAVISGIGCSSRFPLLYEHIRFPLDPRTCHCDRIRIEDRTSRSERVGRHR